MKKINVAINGFGRIGRVFFRCAFNHPDINIVAINDITDSGTLAHLLKYDSIHRRFPGEITHDASHIYVNGKEVKIFSSKDPEKLPWKDLNIDIVIECTGLFLDKESAQKHLNAGAKKIIISAPAKDDDIRTIVMGVNDDQLLATDTIVSNASCTTNCASPMLQVLKQWGIEEAYVTTVHSYTGDQRLHDAPHKDLRRARAAAMSIIPTTTGAAKALGKIFPDLEDKLGGCGMRVPVSDGSLTDITCVLTDYPSVEQIKKAFKEASENELRGILEYSEDPLVSVDVIGNPHSVIFDSDFTSVVGNLVKVIGWYDNEYGYSSRIVDLIVKMQSFK